MSKVSPAPVVARPNEQCKPVMAIPASQMVAAIKVPAHLMGGVPLAGAAGAAAAITGFTFAVFSILFAGAFADGVEKGLPKFSNQFTKSLTEKLENNAYYSFGAGLNTVEFEYSLFKDAFEALLGVDYDDNRGGHQKYSAIIKDSQSWGEFKSKVGDEKLDSIGAEDKYQPLEQMYNQSSDGNHRG